MRPYSTTKWLRLSSPGGHLGEAALSPLLLDALPRKPHLRMLDCQCFGLVRTLSQAAACPPAGGGGMRIHALRRLCLHTRCHAALKVLTFVDERRKGLARAAAQTAATGLVKDVRPFRISPCSSASSVRGLHAPQVRLLRHQQVLHERQSRAGSDAAKEISSSAKHVRVCFACWLAELRS
jgi:hypothetical protein